MQLELQNSQARKNARLKGFALTGLGVLLISPDSLLVKVTHASPVVFLFWRGLLLALGFAGISLVRYGRGLPRQYRRCGRRGLYCALAFAVSTSGFVMGMKHTAAGNVLVIINTSPVIAGIMAFAIWRERLPRRTWFVIAVCVAGATLMALGDSGGGNTLGLVMAGLVAFGLASNLTVARSRPDADMSVMLVVGALLAAAFAASLGGARWPGWSDMRFILLLCLGFLPAASTLIQTGPRYLPAAEVSLMLLLETVIGSLLVWLFLGEVPPPLSFAGGGVILATLAGNAAFDLFRQRWRVRAGIPPH